MFLPYIYRVDCVANIWTQGPEPWRLMGLSRSLICLVIRHQASRGCPSTESDIHEECLRTQPAGMAWTGMRVQKNFSGAVPTGTAVLYAAERGNIDPL